jgi:hypothetical protein
MKGTGQTAVALTIARFAQDLAGSVASGSPATRVEGVVASAAPKAWHSDIARTHVAVRQERCAEPSFLPTSEWQDVGMPRYALASPPSPPSPPWPPGAPSAPS